MPLTNGELTLLAPLVGAPIGAIITLVATRRTAKETLEAQRQIATQTLTSQRQLERDKRLYDRRAELYVDFFESGDLEGLKIQGVLEGSYTYDDLLEQLRISYPEIFADYNKVLIFAGPQVRADYVFYHERYSELRHVCQRLNAISHPIQQPEHGPPVQVPKDDATFYNDHHDEVRYAYEALEQAYRLATVAMRAELQAEVT